MKWNFPIAFVAFALPACAQVRFEVASIHPADPNTTARDARFSFEGNRFEVKAATVGDILDMLGGFQLYRVTGGPAWMRADRYNISAKASSEIKPADRNGAVMALLAERFKLESHRVTRDVPGIIVRAARLPSGVKVADATERTFIRNDRHSDVAFTAIGMSAFTNYLSQMWHVPVVDETGFPGAYDFVLPISQVPQHGGQSWGDRVREAVEALGFRVEDRKVSVEVTVVDRCERPDAN